jgi:hypothetical protein
MVAPFKFPLGKILTHCIDSVLFVASHHLVSSQHWGTYDFRDVDAIFIFENEAKDSNSVRLIRCIPSKQEHYIQVIDRWCSVWPVFWIAFFEMGRKRQPPNLIDTHCFVYCSIFSFSIYSLWITRSARIVWPHGHITVYAWLEWRTAIFCLVPFLIGNR